jgi:hypothetical protein
MPRTCRLGETFSCETRAHQEEPDSPPRRAQAIDTFLVRMGDRLIFVVLTTVVAWLVLGEHRRITAPAAGPGA